MEKRCINCYEFNELSEEAKEFAAERIRESDILYEVAVGNAQEAAKNALADYGFELEEGPFYDLYRREFGLRASYVGNGVKEAAKAFEDIGADVSIAITLEHGCCGRPYSGFEVEVYEPGSGNCEGVRSEAQHLAELAFRAAKEAVEDEWDYVYSDEYIEDFCVANGFLFKEDGHLCPL